VPIFLSYALEDDFDLKIYVQFPGIALMEAVEHVLQYMRDTRTESVIYTRGSRNPNELWSWVDADWAGDNDARRSHTAYILMINGGPISWFIRRLDFLSLCLPPKPNSLPPVMPGKRLFIFVKP